MNGGKAPSHNFARAITALLTLGICGCAIDQFGGRANDYNFQTADARNATILSNVMRAAYSKPLEFTDITTMAGTATASGTASLGVVLPQNHAAQIAARTFTLTPSATASGTGTVNVANLDTQEFFYGLQTPLTMQQVAYYIVTKFGGLDENELLPLLISDIELRSSDGRVVILHNRADTVGSYNAFYSAVNFLIQNGLTVQPMNKGQPTKVGPPLSESDVKNPTLLAAIVSAASGSSSSSSTSGTSSSGSPAGGGSGLTLVGPDSKGMYQFEKGGSQGGAGNFQFCFAQLEYPQYTADPQGYVDFTIQTSPKDPLPPFALGKAFGRPIKNLTINIGSKYYCNSGKNPTPPPSPPPSSGPAQKVADGITITTRSLEGIFQYLGEMTRTELGLAAAEPASLGIPITNDPNGPKFNLFQIARRLPALGEPWVLYNGEIYSIIVDPSGRSDASSRVLQLVSDLLALQSSAKNLPAPNLIAITSP